MHGGLGWFVRLLRQRWASLAQAGQVEHRLDQVKYCLWKLRFCSVLGYTNLRVHGWLGWFVGVIRQCRASKAQAGRVEYRLDQVGCVFWMGKGRK